MGGWVGVPCGTGEATGCTLIGLVGGWVGVSCNGDLTGGILTVLEGGISPCGNGEYTVVSPEKCSLTLIMFLSIFDPSSNLSACTASSGLAKLT